ncbi:MAG TPA: segregation/condensation protein A [Clostridia bacterium]|nr:segregation/condensation protein A [Clostridia bacterium]
MKECVSGGLVEFQVRTSCFEGPLDLLLHLVRQRKVDIKEVSLSDITDEYLEYLRGAQGIDLESASEFAVVAATLIRIKARMLLPSPPAGSADEESASEGEDPANVLKSKLLFYAKIKEAATKLREFEARSRKRFRAGHSMAKTPPSEPDFGFPIGFDLDDIRDIYINLVRRRGRLITPPPVPVRRKTFSARLREVMAFLKGIWCGSRANEEDVANEEDAIKRPVDFWQIVGENRANKSDTVLTLLVILELVKGGFVRIYEQKPLLGFSLVGTRGLLSYFGKKGRRRRER